MGNRIKRYFSRDLGTPGPSCEFTDTATCSGNGVAEADGTCVCNDDLEGIACDEIPESGGCGCSTNGSPISGGLAGLFALGFLLLGTRRRKRNGVGFGSETSESKAGI